MTRAVMTRKPARTLLFALVALVAVLPTATASASRPAPPRITNVAPLNLGIGDQLTIRGTGFRAGADRNTVVFKRDGGRAVFVKADQATATTIRLTVPTKLSSYLSKKTSGGARPTLFRLRVLSARFGRAFTPTRLSPRISEASTTGGSGSSTTSTTTTITNGSGQQTVVTSTPSLDCDSDGVPNSVDTDDDNDLLSDTLEAQIHTLSCNADTDGDGLQDGWEYQSAIDLNNPGCGNPAYPTPCTPAVPYPHEMPYPNPLYGGDANTDFDGDGLTAAEEYTAWARHVGHDLSISGMWYSDGLQASQDDPANTLCVGLTPPAPLLGVAGYSLDRDGNGCLTDDERDEDNDYLTNFEEAHGQLSGRSYWNSVYGEVVFQVAYAGTSWLVQDTDGDGVVDGLDDQDHDDFWNVEELRRGKQSVDKDGNLTGYTSGLWVDPFNPCLPATNSRTCPRYLPASGPVWAPFVPPSSPQPLFPRWPLWNEYSWPGTLPPTHPLTPIPA
jgi:hypothetical protein